MDNFCEKYTRISPVIVSVFIAAPVSLLHMEICNYFQFVLKYHSLPLQAWLCLRFRESFFLFFPSCILSVWAFLLCSPSWDKQLTFGMTLSTLIREKYFTVPLFKAVNLISEGTSYLAIIFWTIKPISEEWILSRRLFNAHYVEPFERVSTTRAKWAIVVAELSPISCHWAFGLYLTVAQTLRNRLYYIWSPSVDIFLPPFCKKNQQHAAKSFYKALQLHWSALCSKGISIMHLLSYVNYIYYIFNW